MALKSTIYKAQVQISDLDRHYYDEANLTLAQHPSENDARMMLRLLSWIHNADERLEFNKELCESDEAEVWIRDYSGEINLWIAFGLPDEKILKRACSRAKQVRLYAYGERAASVWWQSMQPKTYGLENLEVILISDEQLAQLAAMAQRSMQLQVTIQDETLWISSDTTSLEISPQWLKR